MYAYAKIIKQCLAGDTESGPVERIVENKGIAPGLSRWCPPNTERTPRTRCGAIGVVIFFSVQFFILRIIDLSHSPRHLHIKYPDLWSILPHERVPGTAVLAEYM